MTITTQVARAEAILCNMLVEHNLPFLLMGHLPGLLVHAFPDSKISKGLFYERISSKVMTERILLYLVPHKEYNIRSST